MANAQKGEVGFTAAGQQFKLVLDNNALCELEEQTGRGIADIGLEIQSWAPPFGPDKKPLPETGEQRLARAKRIKMALLRSLLWAGLREHHDHMTLKDAGNLIKEIGGVQPTMDVVVQALALAFPDSTETKEEIAARPPTPDSQQPQG